MSGLLAGWNGGKTGPTCPSCHGPCCGEVYYTPVGRGMETVAISIDTESQEQADEFAFLMAAAPELAKALEGLIACISETRGETADNALHEARAALAKSRGES